MQGTYPPQGSGVIQTGQIGYQVRTTGTTSFVTKLVSNGQLNSVSPTSNSTSSLMMAPSASGVSYDNTATGLDCTEAQCALDKIKEMIGE